MYNAKIVNLKKKFVKKIIKHTFKKFLLLLGLWRCLLIVGVYYDILWKCFFSCRWLLKKKKKLLSVSIRELFKTW